VDDAPVETTAGVVANAKEDSANDTAISLWTTTPVYGPGGGSDETSQTLSYKITAIPSFITLLNGTTTVAANDTLSAAEFAALTYKTVASSSGSASLTFDVIDSGSNASPNVNTLSGQSATVSVFSINNAPSGTDATIEVLEDASYTFSTANFGFNDDPVDTPANNFQGVIITAPPAAGSLTLDGVAVTANQSISVADINSNKLKFAPAANANGSAYATFSFQVQDDGGTNNGGQDTDPTANTITIDVTSVNDDPSGANPTITFLEDGSHTFSPSDFGFSDPLDSLAISQAGGNSLLAVLIASAPSTGTLTLNGTPVNSGERIAITDIDAGQLVYTPANNANGSAYATFSFQVQDDGGTGNGGLDTDSTPRTVSNLVVSVNDAPVGADNTITTLEDKTYVFGTGDFGFSDPNDSTAASQAGGNNLKAVKITAAPTAGKLTLDQSDVSAGQSIAAGDIEAGKLAYTPAENGNGDAYTAFSFQLQDDGGTDNGGIDTSIAENTISIDVTPVNDAPTGKDSTLTTLEDEGYTLNEKDFGFSDPDDAINIAQAGGNSFQAITITEAPENGSLTLNGDAVDDGQSVDADDINNGKLIFRPEANANGDAYSAFSFKVQDDGGTDNDGDDTAEADNTLTFDVTSVNDAPLGQNGTIGTLEGTSYTFNEKDFGFSDPDDSISIAQAGGNSLQSITITETPGTGSLTVNGETINAGDQIDAADIQNLSFQPNAYQNGNAYSNFQFELQDDGGTDNDGEDTSANTYTISVDVGSVNNAPTGANNTISTQEDTPYIFSATDFGFSDPQDTPANAFQAVFFPSKPTQGTLLLNGNAISNGTTASVDDINNGHLVFVPATNANGSGYATVSFRVLDDGGRANGGTDIDPTAKTITIDVTPVDDPAAVSGDISGQATQGSTITGQLNAFDPEAPLRFSIDPNNAASHGSASIDGDAAWTYVPNRGFFGNDRFTVIITDDNGGTTLQTISVTVLAPAAPSAPTQPAAADTIQSVDDDNDGVLERIKTDDGTIVDGNRDGISDAEQSQVAGLDLIGDGSRSSDYGAITAASGTTLENVTLISSDNSSNTFPVATTGGSVAVETPTGITNLFKGVLAFNVAGIEPGGSTEVTITLPTGLDSDKPNAYIRYNYTSKRFEDYRDSNGNPLYQFADTNNDGNIDSVILQLQDGDSNWDGDGTANGVVVDPGYAASGEITFRGNNNERNTIIGNLLNNALVGGNKGDWLAGSRGDDTLRGKKGKDRLYGGAGADDIKGGKDSDRIIYFDASESTTSQRDTIHLDRKDRLVFNSFDGDSTSDGQQSLRYIGTDSFSGSAGELRYTGNGLEADTTGDGSADFAVNFTNTTNWFSEKNISL
jgi:hypothetical protein